jgi:hypothetical protein
MTRTKLILAGLLAGTLALGSACKSDQAAERGPAGTTTTPTGEQGTATDTGTSGDTGGGTGGAGDEGYVEDDPRFDDSQELGGNKFPSDDVVPQ